MIGDYCFLDTTPPRSAEFDCREKGRMNFGIRQALQTFFQASHTLTLHKETGVRLTKCGGGYAGRRVADLCFLKVESKVTAVPSQTGEDPRLQEKSQA
jgi:hypothetical protein